MSKKLLSVVLALALALSCFAVSAFALGDYGYENEADAAYYKQTWALGEPQDIGGGEYTVDVILTTNYLVGPIQFQVLKTISAGSLTLVDAYAEDTDIPENWNATVSFLDATGEVAVIPYPTEDGVSALDCTGGKVVATLVFAASADVAATAAINVADAKSASNPGGLLIAARMSDGNVVTGAAITGQTVTNTSNPSVTFGAAVSNPPELVVVDGTIGVIDTSRTMLDADDIDGDGDLQEVDGYLLGYDPDVNSDLSELFEVVGDGTMEVVATEAGSETATGTMVNVLDLDSNVVASYVLIVFGDANGDGVADATDAGMIELHDAYLLEPYERLYTYQDFACDVNVDEVADATDAGMVELHDAYLLEPNERIDIAGILTELGF